MMVFFFTNMMENQCLSTGAFEISLNDVPVCVRAPPTPVYMMGSRLSKAAVMKVCTESGVSAGVGRMSSSSFLVLWESVMYTAGGVSPVYLEFWEVLLEQSLH
ncbi:hypothetical protein PGIGA_G00229840 [Pangasianodon gigas]|uniref:Uncharacterized protein n=1 Tax=Pangasianodon gigas TaxID=30993 RepID=A0ACC5WKK5_PANGG|nr:hypothetical protein [Pangasianodon gigas]